MFIVFIISFIVFSNNNLFPVYAKEISAKGKYLTIEDAVNIAIQNNPLIKSKKNKVEAAKGKIKQAKLIPNPVINLVAEEAPTNEIGLNESQNMVSLSQKLELGGKRRLRTDAAKKQKNILNLDTQTAIRNITAKTKKAFFDLPTAQDELNLAKKNVEIATS